MLSKRSTQNWSPFIVGVLYLIWQWGRSVVFVTQTLLSRQGETSLQQERLKPQGTHGRQCKEWGVSGIFIDGGTKTEEKTVAHQTSLELLWFLCNLKGQVSVRWSLGLGHHNALLLCFLALKTPVLAATIRTGTCNETQYIYYLDMKSQNEPSWRLTVLINNGASPGSGSTVKRKWNSSKQVNLKGRKKERKIN